MIYSILYSIYDIYYIYIIYGKNLEQSKRMTKIPRACLWQEGREI